jgi:hypothetical protein
LEEQFLRCSPDTVLVVGKRCEGSQTAAGPASREERCTPDTLNHWFLIRGLSHDLGKQTTQAEVASTQQEARRALFSGQVWNFAGNGGAAFSLQSEGPEVWWSELDITHVVAVSRRGT